MRRSLAISQGDAMIFLQKPLSLALLIITLAVLVLPTAFKLYRSRRAPS